MFNAVPHLSDELIDPLGRYAELSSRFASGDGWLEKAKTLRQPGCALSALPSVGRNVPDQRLISALPGEDVETHSELRESLQQGALMVVVPGDGDVMNRCIDAG